LFSQLKIKNMDHSKVLTPEDIEVINGRFSLDLAYNNAQHYRAAQAIWNLWKWKETTSPEATNEKEEEES
jgi:hypothetical protein